MTTILFTYADHLLKIFIRLVLQFLSVLLSAILDKLFPLNDREPCKASVIKETGDKEGIIHHYHHHHYHDYYYYYHHHHNYYYHHYTYIHDNDKYMSTYTTKNDD
jgi:hypothetical protein